MLFQAMMPYDPRWSQMISDDPRSRWSRMSPDDPRWSKMIPDAPRRDNLRWLPTQMIPDDPRWSQTRWSQMSPDPDDCRWSLPTLFGVFRKATAGPGQGQGALEAGKAGPGTLGSTIGGPAAPSLAGYGGVGVHHQPNGSKYFGFLLNSMMNISGYIYIYIYIYMIPARGPQTKLKEIHGLCHHGDERTCPQVLRAKHLLTTGVLQQFWRREILEFRLLAFWRGLDAWAWA